MPSDVVTIAVSTGIGVSVLAGVLSGVCYVLAHGFPKKRTCESGHQWHCIVCGTYLRPQNEKHIKAVICVSCKERVCKQRCSMRQTKNQWMCYTCLKRPSWLQGIFSSVRLPYKKLLSPNKKTDRRCIEMAKRPLPKFDKEKEYVRDFIEKLVSTIVGSSVDDASVFRMYNDKHYSAFFERYHRDLSDAITSLSSSLQMSIKNLAFSDENPSSAHTNLKLLIEKVLHEAVRLPKFRRPVTSVSQENDQTYENLLATAILNKAVTKSKDSTHQYNNNHRPNHLDEPWEPKWDEIESTSNSSFDDYLRSDSNRSSIKCVDRVSLTIQQRIEEVPSLEQDEDYFPTGSSSSLNDQSNWFLQKKPFNGANSPVPVPMLVPNPIINAKVLIGDQEIDETSDLSDANSEVDEVDIPVLELDTNLEVELANENNSFDSGVRDDVDSAEKFYGPEAINYIFDDERDLEYESYIGTDRDLEYLEKYPSVARPSSAEFGRDYYTRMAGSPSGGSKGEENAPSDDLYRAVPISTTTDTESENSLESFERLKRTFSKDEPSYTSDTSSNSGINFYNVEQSQIIREPEITVTLNQHATLDPEQEINITVEFDKDYEPKRKPVPAKRGPPKVKAPDPPLESVVDAVENAENLNTKNFKDENSEVKYLEDVENDEDINSQLPKVQINRQEKPEAKEIFDGDEKIFSTSDDENDEDIISQLPKLQINRPEKPEAEENADEKIAFTKSDVESDDDINSQLPKVQISHQEKPEAKEKFDGDEKIVFTTSDVEDEDINSQLPKLQINRQEKPEAKKMFDANEKIVITASAAESDEDSQLPKVLIHRQEKPEAKEKFSGGENIVFTTSDVESDEEINSQLPKLQINRQEKTDAKEQFDLDQKVPLTPSGAVNKKLDNTLIKKIYADPAVRNFALGNRDQIPYESEVPTPAFSLDNDEIYIDQLAVREFEYLEQAHKAKPSNGENKNDGEKFSLEFSDYGSNTFDEKSRFTEPKRLEKSSLSLNNLDETDVNENAKQKNLNPETHKIGTEEYKFASVKDLRKIFENKDQSAHNKKEKSVHSLTARSIPERMRKNLRNDGIN